MISLSTDHPETIPSLDEKVGNAKDFSLCLVCEQFSLNDRTPRKPDIVAQMATWFLAAWLKAHAIASQQRLQAKLMSCHSRDCCLKGCHLFGLCLGFRSSPSWQWITPQFIKFTRYPPPPARQKMLQWLNKYTVLISIANWHQTSLTYAGKPPG